jgi:hypothetical protein
MHIDTYIYIYIYIYILLYFGYLLESVEPFVAGRRRSRRRIAEGGRGRSKRSSSISSHING